MRGRLRVGVVAPPWVPVPPPDYGGTELVVDQLCRGLVAARCEVVLVTTGDSTCPVERRWHVARAVGTNAPVQAEAAHVAFAYRELARAGVDVVHDHTVLGPMWGAERAAGAPTVATIHGPLQDGLAGYYRAVGARVALVAISAAQAAAAPSVPVAEVIHHGIDVEAVPVGPGDGGYAVFLGRMSPQKGVVVAIRAARRAGRRLVIAAKMWEPDEVRYFEREVSPLLGADVTYVGQVAGAAKYELLGRAEALLNPISWHEPFGLVMAEALACGTPVLAFPHGSAPEIVDDGRTGFVCADEDDLATRLAEVRSLDRAACRAAAEARFSRRRMVARHLDLYRRVLGDAATLAS